MPSQRAVPPKLSSPTESPWRRATNESSSIARSTWSKCGRSPSTERMRLPVSSTIRICWSRSSWYSREISVGRRALAFQSICRCASPAR
jgi:hypothetical protein